MIYIRSGAHVLELLQLLSVAGEFPMSGLSILGNPRTMRELIHRLEDRQEIEASWSGKRYCARLLSISGKRGPMRNILSHLDGDLARLVRFRLAAIEDKERRYEAICYPWQLEYVKPFLGERIELKLIDPARIAAALQRR